MSNKLRKFFPTTAEDGVLIGFIVLAALVIFTVWLPKWQHGHANAEITLPKTLSGGFTLVDGTTKDPRAAQMVSGMAQLDSSLASAQSVASKTAMYLDQAKHDQLIVQVVRAGGESPMLEPPSSGTYAKVGNDTCFSQQGQGGAESICVGSATDLTAQVTGSGDAATVAKHLDEVLKGLN